MSREYYVEWRIEIEAGSPREAAEFAREIQLDPNGTAEVFDITDGDGMVYKIDLEEGDNDQ